VPGQYIQNYQVQVYMRARETGCTQPEAAAIAGFSERSGRRIEQGEHQPKYGQDRDWRTRRDPLAEVWVFDDNYFLPSRQLYVEAIGACSKGLSTCSSCRFAQK
jgi:hypothetical protein